MYKVLVADPGWMFNDKLPEIRGAESHYRTMTLEQIKQFPIPPMFLESHLFLWRVAALQEEALSVIRAWGYVLKAELVWIKKTKTGKRHFGMGRQVRYEHEVCLIATCGNAMPKTRSIRSTFEAPVGQHSEKPEKFYQIVEELCDGPYAELFARRARPGWWCYGEELPK
jgi:N6-adenosine-specific RNA methylase IME4